MRWGACVRNDMRLNFFVITACILLAIGLTHWASIQSPPSSQLAAATLRQAVDFNLPDISGRMHRLKNYRGKNVVINFWASWCAPCIIEFPILLSTARKHPDTIFLLISIDDKVVNLTGFISRQPAKLKTILNQPNVILLQDAKREVMQNRYQIDQVPETLLLDRDQNIRRHWRGSSVIGTELAQALHRIKESDEFPASSPHTFHDRY